MIPRRRPAPPALHLVRSPAVARAMPPRVPALDDAEMLAAVRRGDAAAAQSLHDRVLPQIERTVARLLGRHDPDRDDLVQLSMIELVRSLHRFRAECSLDTWTSKISARTVFKEIRRRRSDRTVFGDGPDDDSEPASHHDLDRDVTWRDALRRIRGHFDALHTDQAWTLMLHDVCGYDLREIGEITGVSVAAAQSRLVRGRKALHERIASDPELAEILCDREGAR